METVARDYSAQGVKFYYIYKALAHPETGGYVTPFNLRERLMHVAEAKRTLGSQIEWICDTMDNDLKHALGDRPNSEFIVDPAGKIVVSRAWSNPTQLRSDLERFVGEVEHPTRVADLDMKQPAAIGKAPTGIVPRLDTPPGMSPLKLTPLPSKTPFYAKLRAELGGGKLYLGFSLDPLYQVHWNNKAAAIRYSIQSPPGVTVSPDSGEGPYVTVDADADPREFLATISGRSDDPIKVTVKYFACDDAETFCIPVTQEYLVSLDRDPDGGNRRVPRGRGGPPTAARPTAAPTNDRFQQMMQRIPVMATLDIDGDGKLSAAELAAASQSLRKLDTNGDGDLSSNEIRPAPPRR